jgi:predicted dehydrogenase
MKEIIRWGILGTGEIAKQFATGLSFVDDAQLYAVGARQKEKAEEFSRQYNVPHCYGSFEELLAEPNIDVVYIATPHHVHRDHCLMVLEAGKSVLCEKPFTINASQAREVIELARKKKLFCMEAMWMRFVPAMRQMSHLIENDTIGEPSLLRADFGVPFEFNPSSRLFDQDLAGGALLDLGVYTVSLSYKLFGAPVDILTTANIGESGVDESSSIILKHAGGQISTLRSSIRYELTPEAVIVGSKGSIRVESPIYRPHKIQVSKCAPVLAVTNSQGASSKIKKIIQKTPALQKLALHVESYLTPISSALGTKVIPFEGNGYNYQVAAVNQCLKEGKLESEIMPLNDTLGVLMVMDEIRQQWGLRYAGE